MGKHQLWGFLINRDIKTFQLKSLLNFTDCGRDKLCLLQPLIRRSCQPIIVHWHAVHDGGFIRNGRVEEGFGRRPEVIQHTIDSKAAAESPQKADVVEMLDRAHGETGRDGMNHTGEIWDHGNQKGHSGTPVDPSLVSVDAPASIQRRDVNMPFLDDPVVCSDDGGNRCQEDGQ